LTPSATSIFPRDSFFWDKRPFDHNYGQDLNLQQIYGGGLGWTALKTPKQESGSEGNGAVREAGFHHRGLVGESKI